jgi:hypothetical protein
MILDTEKRAKDSILFALKFRRVEEKTRIEPSPLRPEIRLPLTPKKPVNVEAVLDEVMERFPKTLDYLAK